MISAYRGQTLTASVLSSALQALPVLYHSKSWLLKLCVTLCIQHTALVAAIAAASAIGHLCCIGSQSIAL
eukprot:18327-Heterococcus_DN1.PRE.6